MPPLRHMCQNGKEDETRPTASQAKHLAVALLEGTVDFALNVAFCHVFTLVVELFAAAQAQQQLYATIGIKESSKGTSA